MRILYRFVLLGMLLGSCHEAVSMIAALQKLEGAPAPVVTPPATPPQPTPQPQPQPIPQPQPQPQPTPQPQQMPQPQPSDPSMPQSGPQMPPSEPPMPSSDQSMPPSGPPMPDSVPSMPPSGPQMPPSGPPMPEIVEKPKKVPTPKAIQAKATLQVSEVQSTGPEGLDTINIDSGGNWLEKRIWFKKAEQLFDDIRTAVEKASDMRTEFVEEVNSVGKKIDFFYEQASFEKGQIDEIVKQIQFDISQALAKRGGDLSANERSMKAAGQAEQKEIEQIGNDIKKVDDFDSQIDKAMMQAFKTIDDCRSLEGKAWNNFKSIGAELDDKKARTLYYEMENAQKNIEQNIKYLQTTLLPYVRTKLVSQVEQLMKTIQTTVQSLADKGVNLDALIKTNEQKDVALEKEREAQKEKMAEDDFEKRYQAQEQAKHADAKGTAKKTTETQAAWHVRFAESFVGTLQCITCKVAALFKSVSDKVVELAPGVFESIKNSWNSFLCYLKCIICSIKTWLCNLFGKFD